MAKVLATPGVYVEEKSAFSSSIVAVPTAVPAFIGYTQRALRGKKELTDVPTKVSSLAEYIDMFGGAPKTTFTITPNEETDFSLSVNKDSKYMLYNSLRLFFANGGGNCYIVSVGSYSDAVGATALTGVENEGGLTALLKEQEPTMIVIPDAVLLEVDDCYSLYQAVIKHCGFEMQSRVTILDIHGGDQSRTLDDEDIVSKFRESVGSNFLSFAAAYYPWVNTTIVQANEISYSNVSNTEDLVAILNKEVDDNLAAGLLKEKRADDIKAEIAKLSDAKSGDITLDQTLKAVSPIYKDVLDNMRDTLNVLPPSSAMAGVYSMVDNSVGVHKAPANVSMGSVISPVVNITSANQEDLNLPLNGKAVNAIRSFIGKGTLVWGARTLDGNSQDWRYISVRRALIMIEQSVKTAVEAYVFDPNDASTWLKVKTAIDNFLTTLWKSGTLVGSSTTEAFETSIGLGVTMTPNDILDGVMRISVKVAISRPAEFIVITFQQKMQES
ncbi:MAG: phage tail sheath protein FI [Cognaticolwellia sp.]|jgi:phage tail sheath protein FI